MNENIKQNHILKCENRNGVFLSGIIDVDIFTTEEIKCKTDYGNLSIKGENLHVESLDVSSGDMCIKGKITSFYYMETKNVKGFFRRAFQ